MTHRTPDFIRLFDVAAPIERVWDVMSDVERWHEWTASITRVTLSVPGPIAPGVVGTVKQPKFPPAKWLVTEVVPGRHFIWVTATPGIKCTAFHGVEPTPAGTRVTLSLTYEGALTAPLLWATRGITDHYLDLEMAGLKARSERSAPVTV